MGKYFLAAAGGALVLLAGLFLVFMFFQGNAFGTVGISPKMDGAYSYSSVGLGKAKTVNQPIVAMEEAVKDLEFDNGNMSGGGSNALPLDKKVIKNGSLSLYVAQVETAVEQIRALTAELNGFVEAANVQESDDGEKSAYVTIRIPAVKFEETMNNVKQLAAEVETENVSSQDVTAEFVDYEARLNNWRAQESQYLEIMKKATSVEDILKVSAKLGETRGEIESLEGNLKYLSRQVDMSTIRINLSSDGDVKVWGLKWRPLIVAKKALKNMLSGLTGYVDAMVNLVLFLPVLLLWAVTVIVVLALIWKIGGWVRRKFFAKA